MNRKSAIRISISVLTILCITLIITLSMIRTDMNHQSTIPEQNPQVVIEEQIETLPEVVEDTSPDQASDKYSWLRNQLNEAEKQLEIDHALLVEAENGYTFDEPFVMLDPYNASPLTAVVIFDTEQPSRVSVHVSGDTPLADIDFTFDSYNTRHIIPIYGLYAGRVNPVELVITNERGGEETRIVEIETEQLPPFFEEFILITDLIDPENYQSGLNFTWRSMEYRQSFAFDVNGAVRWFLTNGDDYADVVRYSQDTKGIMLTRHTGEIERINPLGKVLGFYYSMSGDIHHDLIFTDYDTCIFCIASAKSDGLAEISLSTGETINQIQYQDILNKNRLIYTLYQNAPNDWMHLNSVVELDGDLVISSNSQSMVMRHSWDGTIKWILGDPYGWTEMYRKYLLTPIGENFEWPYNQHAAEILPDYDNNPDTVDIIVFDNGTRRDIAEPELEEKYSRIVCYRINEHDMTVEQTWSYGEDMPWLFSGTRGDANMMDSGTILATFNISKKDGNPDEPPYYTVHTEVSRDKKVVWQAIAQSLTSNHMYSAYRLERGDIYTPNANDLHIGEPFQNLIPVSILEQIGYPTE